MQRSERIHRVAGHICQPESGIVTMPCAGAGSGFKVAAIGAGGGIGQPLALLLKLSPKISELRLYDVVGTLGVGADLSHIDSGADLKAYVGPPEDTAPLMAALKGADLVVITAGIARKPGMTRDDLFSINAGIVKGIITAAADACPNAVFNIISNPVNSLVPMAKAILESKGVYDKKKLLGVTTLDLVRAQTFVAENQGLDVTKTVVPVIGGHSGNTILPLLSQVPGTNFSDKDVEALTDRIQNAGTEVVDAKAGAGSATLSTAYSGFIFIEKCLDGLAGKPDVYDYTYVDDDGPDAIDGVAFFGRKVRFGPEGIAEICSTGALSAYEAAAQEGMLEELKANITKGVEFA